MVKLRIERKNRIATLYFIQGICIEKRGKIWIADVLLKEVRLRDNTKSVGIKLCARTIEYMTEDGSIVINTKIRTDGIKAGTAEIEAGVHRAADRVNTLGSNVKKAINNQMDSFVKLNNEYSAQEQKVESLRQKVAAYANQRIPTAEYKEITAQIEQAQEKLNRLTSKTERTEICGYWKWI